MGITVLIALENHSRQAVAVLNIENASTAGSGVSVAPGSAISTNMYIPWASSDGDFNGHRLELRYDGTTRFWIWQDGDFVRFSTDGHWHAGGSPVPGFAGVGFALGAPSPDATRSIIVQDDCFEVVDFNGLPITAAFQELIGTVGYRMCDAQPAEPAPMPTMASVPKSTSVAFSVAGIPSDAFESGKPGARFLFGDSGKRYAFEIRDGVVFAKSAGLPDVALTTTVSYNQKRKRLADTTTMPPVDLIASNGGRVFAKAKDRNSFYFTTMDDMFVGGDDSGEFIAPSTYFKVDPEFNHAGASNEDLVGHLAGSFRGYPAVERFPLFRFLIQQPIVDFMIVRLERRTWHLLDVRPPLASLDGNTIAISILQHALLPISGLYDLVKGVIGPLSTLIDAMFNAAKQQTEQTASPPPNWVRTYRHVDYCSGPNTMSLQSIAYDKVLDIGVGAVHWHEQYESLTGGELQPLRSGPVVSNFTYLQLYQLLNGPIRDADGYIDGTCNYYALVRLKTDDTDRHDAYGVLYVDEQSYFTQRWRLVHPADCVGTRGVAKDIDSNADRYGWNKATYWCPSRDGRLTARSRLAVSRQVLVVSGEEPDGTALLYSINFSYSTMDRTWRWRPLPPAATVVAYFANDAEAGAETIAPTPNSVYPQTLRLREDMTLHLKGMQGNTLGRWYQRYLPASNELVPHADQLVAGTRPSTGYTHPWKFAAEDVFQAADQFSHFGVYDTVDSRTQYYTVEPVAGDPVEDVWTDDGRQISLGAVKFWWPAPLHPELDVRRPPSIFNPVTRLRLAKRGSRWIAMHADKRDDELRPFDLPVQVDLTSAGRRITVKLTANTWVERPPAVRTVYFWWEGAVAALAFTTPIGAENAVFDNVARVRIGALAQGAVVTLLDLRTEGSVGFNDGYLEYRWTPSAADAALLARYCTVDGAAASGTSIWFEDIVGHVATSESAVVWNWPPVVRVTVAPAQIPLGIPVAVSIHAVNKYDGTVLHGSFTVDDGASGTSDVVLTHTFNGHVETSAPDPIEPGSGPRVGHGPPPHATGDLVTPIGTMRVAGYPDADIPFNFYTPRLDVGIDTTAFVIGQSGQFNVTARDTTTKAAVPAQVFVGTTNVGAANGAQPLVHVFSAGDSNGSVTAQGYPSFLIAFHLSAPPPPPPPPPATLVVNVDPSTFPIGKTVQVTVHAQNSVTRAPVSGSVAINGTVVGSTNVPFAYTVPKKALGPKLTKLQPGDGLDTTSTTITVSAPGFAPVTVEI